MGMSRQDKRAEDVRWVLEMMHRYDCLDYGRAAAHRFAMRAKDLFAEAMGHAPESPHKQFLDATIGYVIERER
jgi:hypothetical protein